jgi:hypothetical protein
VKDTVEWLAAEADESEELSGDQNPRLVSAKSAETRTGHPEKSEDVQEDQNPEVEVVAEYATRLENDCDYENERVRRIYRARVVTMLRRYLQYSIETGRLPSLLGREFFRAKVTSYTVVTFEDQEATGRLLGCTERTVRTYVPIVLDLFTEILFDVGLLAR